MIQNFFIADCIDRVSITCVFIGSFRLKMADLRIQLERTEQLKISFNNLIYYSQYYLHYYHHSLTQSVLVLVGHSFPGLFSKQSFKFRVGIVWFSKKKYRLGKVVL